MWLKWNEGQDGENHQNSHASEFTKLEKWAVKSSKKIGDEADASIQMMRW